MFVVMYKEDGVWKFNTYGEHSSTAATSNESLDLARRHCQERVDSGLYEKVKFFAEINPEIVSYRTS